MKFLVGPGVLLSIVACTPIDNSPAVPPPATRSTVEIETTTTVAPTTGTTVLAEDACPEGEPFLNDGSLLQSERPGADGRAIAGITWRAVGECHIVTISFTTEDGAPATTPPTITARLMRNAGVIRVETAATSSALVDQLVEDGLIGSLFVPRQTDETRFIDLTLTGPAVARARITTSPARLVIEIQPGGSPDMGSPLVTDRVVVVEPGSGAIVEPIIDVSGYSIGEEGLTLDLEVLLADSVVETQEVTLESSPRMWLAFATSIQMGNRAYDSLRISDAEGTVIAGMPFSR